MIFVFVHFCIGAFCKVSWGSYGDYVLDVKEVDGKNKIALAVQQNDADINLILQDLNSYPLIWKNESTGEKIPCYRDRDITITYSLRADGQQNDNEDMGPLKAALGKAHDLQNKLTVAEDRIEQV